jgi:ribosomal protein S18 acetylase RimI-like enzyme
MAPPASTLTARIELRAATQDDVPPIAAMQKASLPETYGPFLGRAAVEEFIAAGNVERYFEEHWPDTVVATIDERIVGVVMCRGTLVDLAWVDPAFRSKGIGAALMADVERRSGGVLRLEVWKVNERAVAFYERLGFATAEEFDDPATGLAKLAMRKAVQTG